ncbi:MAG: SBBP repeat-containing protein [Caldilineaceae bacterium]
MFPAILFPRRGFGPLFSVLLGVFAMGFPSTPLLAQRQDSVAQGASGALFIENVGQFDPRVRFQIYGAAQTIRLTDDGLWLTVATTADDKVAAAQVIDTVDYLRVGQRSATQLHLTYTGADFSRPTPLYRSEASVNYFRGNDPTQWQINVPVWQGVRYQSIYPGVDLEVTVVDSQLTQRLLVQPNVDLSAATATLDGVTLVVAGATALAVDASTLQVETTVGAFTLPRPLAVLATGKSPVAVVDAIGQAAAVVATVKAATVATTQAASPSSTAATTLLYGTFLGGGGDDDQAYGLAADASGNLYLTGRADASDFPATAGDTVLTGGADIFVAKLNPQGNGPADLRYATFIGGGDRDSAIDIVLGDAGQATIAGVTLSSDFPTTAGAYRRALAGASDAVVVTLNADGNALLYATYLGGNDADQSGALAHSVDGQLVVVGATNSTNFPTTAGALQPQLSGGNSAYSDLFIARLQGRAAGAAELTYGSYLGGERKEYALALVLDASGALYGRQD